jgi:REP element-mobilizing transposase RayT
MLPRKAREKHSEAIYHVMSRSISEVLLFREDEDKDYYLKLLKFNAQKYKCSVYAYCLMDNHLHIQLDPKGYDISRFMHGINTSYVHYYNRKYKRHGHLFQERFQSRILDSDRYNLVVSAYIHNNPKDVMGYANRVEEYKYSSFGIYLGIRKDHRRLIDTSFIQGLMGVRKKRNFVSKYQSFVMKQKNVESLKECREYSEKSIETPENEYISGRKVVIREIPPTKVIEYISRKLKCPMNNMLMPSGKQKQHEFKAFVAYVLRVLCGLGYKQICENIYNVTISGCSRLCNRGFELVNRDGFVYADIFDELANCMQY